MPLCSSSHRTPSVIIEKPNEEKHLKQIQGTGGTILKVREIIKLIELMDGTL
jgi:hypothetical protein